MIWTKKDVNKLHERINRLRSAMLQIGYGDWSNRTDRLDDVLARLSSCERVARNAYDRDTELATQANLMRNREIMEGLRNGKD